MVFFFQAEDGIRDVAVTGVQTCALPIYPDSGTESESARLGRVLSGRLSAPGLRQSQLLRAASPGAPSRSPQPTPLSCAGKRESVRTLAPAGVAVLKPAASFREVVYMRAGCGTSARPVR